MITSENLKDILLVEDVGKNAKCALCEQAIDPVEKAMLTLSLKVTLMKVRKSMHRSCAQEVLTASQGILDIADAKAR